MENSPNIPRKVAGELDVFIESSNSDVEKLIRQTTIKKN